MSESMVQHNKDWVMVESVKSGKLVESAQSAESGTLVCCIWFIVYRVSLFLGRGGVKRDERDERDERNERDA